jgi:hypothetical protein
MKSTTKANSRLTVWILGLAMTLAVALALGACDDEGKDLPDPNFDITICDPANGPFSLEIDNHYLPIVVGMHNVLEGQEAGEHFTRIEMDVLEETRDILGVTTRVVRKQAWDDDVYVSDEELYFAQAPDGTVCWYGELEDMYDGEQFLGSEEWIAGEEGAHVGIFMPGTPEVGMVYEMFLDDEEAEIAEITHVGEPTTTPAGTFEDTVSVLEDGESVKKYAAGIGEIYDDGIELIEHSIPE